MPSTDSNLLKHIPLFAQLTEAERRDLANLLKTQVYKPHEPIIWIGDQGTDFFIIQQGHVAISIPDESGQQEELAILGPGAFFGEISLLDGGPRTANAMAQTDATLLSLGREDFLNYLRSKPSVSIHVMTILGQRTRGMLDKLRGVKNVNEAVEQRTTRFQRIADKVASLGASPLFIAVQLIFSGIWVIINELQRDPFDKYPYNFLALIVSGEALILSTFVLMSQNRQNQRDRIRADLDYQVNLKAHLEVLNLHRKVDRLGQLVIDQRNPAIQQLVERVTQSADSPLGSLTETPPLGR
jgi:CRP/FNR family cyclic AMP-dependent transcriptional regulator